MICPIPLRDFAFSGSLKLKNLLASQGRRLKAGVAKDLGQNRTRPTARHMILVLAPKCLSESSVPARTPRGCQLVVASVFTAGLPPGTFLLL